MSLAAHAFLEHEARALLTRLARVQPFVLSETMVPAANLTPAAQRAIDGHLAAGRALLHRQARAFIDELRETMAPADAQRRFALLRLRFNAVLAQFDLFADALAQRAGRDHGVWMAGLDELARDALALPALYEAPPVICYLDRGIGAAIRRARTRLPGGGDNPVAVVRVPRERMVGAGVASSLVHEVGHQAAALLALVEALRPRLQARSAEPAWRHWERWISEIVADFWAVARLGVAAPLGLVAVLSLPRAFVFRSGADDPHPTPWIRVLLACAMGRALLPQSPWDAVAGLWRALYPLQGLPAAQQAQLRSLDAALPAFADWLPAQRPAALQGRRLGDVALGTALDAAALRRSFRHWRHDPAAPFAAAPCRACAVIGQARADGFVSPAGESRLMARLLTHWALRSSLGPAAA